MPSCVITGCKNNSCFQKKSAGITFHKFPGDKTFKEKWIKAVRENRNDVKWLPSKFSVVCSLHFEEIDIYNTKGGYSRIKKNATPKKIHLVNSEWCLPIEASRSSTNPESSTLGLSTENCNIEEEVDTAEIIDETSYKLIQQVRKNALRNKIQARKIRTLNQKIRRLKMRNASLKQRKLLKKEYILLLPTDSNS